MKNSKAAIAISRLVSIIQMAVGAFFLVIFGICTLVYFLDAKVSTDAGSAFLVTCLVFDALGIVLVIFSIKRSRLIREFKKYVSFICSAHTVSIESLASVMGISPDVVKRRLELMIKRDYFVNTHIDQETNCIIIGSGTNNQQGAARSVMQTNTTQSQSAPRAQKIQVICKCCGGVNKIEKGIESECDFCGSPING